MKKIIGLILIGVITIVVGCRKFSGNFEDIKSSNIESLVKGYIEYQINKTTKKEAERFAETLSKINFSHIRIEAFSESLDIIILPIVDINVLDFITLNSATTLQPRTNSLNNVINSQPKMSSVTKAVFYYKNNKITYGNIIEIKSSNLDSAKIDKDFAKIVAAKELDYSGRISVNHLSQHLSNAFEYINGRPVSSTVVQRGRNQTEYDKKVNACLAWYLVTTYFWSDGSTTETSQFVGTTGCGGAQDETLLPTSEGGGRGFKRDAP